MKKRDFDQEIGKTPLCVRAQQQGPILQRARTQIAAPLSLSLSSLIIYICIENRTKKISKKKGKRRHVAAQVALVRGI